MHTEGFLPTQTPPALLPSPLPQPPLDVPSFKADPMTQLIKDMLKEKLSFRIVEAILDAGGSVGRWGH